MRLLWCPAAYTSSLLLVEGMVSCLPASPATSLSAGRPAPHATLQFDGAAGQLPIKLASQLSSRVRTGDPVDWIKQDDGGVTAVTAAGRRYRGKAAILAMPPHQTGRVRYSPPMPGIRDQLTQRSPMGAIIKVGRRDYSLFFFRILSLRRLHGFAHSVYRGSD